jgi:hypothetical protein
VNIIYIDSAKREWEPYILSRNLNLYFLGHI